MRTLLSRPLSALIKTHTQQILQQALQHTAPTTSFQYIMLRLPSHIRVTSLCNQGNSYVILEMKYSNMYPYTHKHHINSSRHSQGNSKQNSRIDPYVSPHAHTPRQQKTTAPQSRQPPSAPPPSSHHPTLSIYYGNTSFQSKSSEFEKTARRTHTRNLHVTCIHDACDMHV